MPLLLRDPISISSARRRRPAHVHLSEALRSPGRRCGAVICRSGSIMSATACCETLPARRMPVGYMIPGPFVPASDNFLSFVYPSRACPSNAWPIMFPFRPPEKPSVQDHLAGIVPPHSIGSPGHVHLARARPSPSTGQALVFLSRRRCSRSCLISGLLCRIPAGVYLLRQRGWTHGQKNRLRSHVLLSTSSSSM